MEVNSINHHVSPYSSSEKNITFPEKQKAEEVGLKTLMTHSPWQSKEASRLSSSQVTIGEQKVKKLAGFFGVTARELIAGKNTLENQKAQEAEKQAQLLQEEDRIGQIIDDL